jgi:hypothetical protein
MKWLMRWLNNGSSCGSCKSDEPGRFCYSRLYGSERYSLQNMLLNEVNYDMKSPLRLRKSVWSDYIPDIWHESQKDIDSMTSGDAFWAGVKPADLLRFARHMLEKSNPEFKTIELIGVRIVRFTGVWDGYPKLRLDVIGQRVSSH